MIQFDWRHAFPQGDDPESFRARTEFFLALVPGLLTIAYGLWFRGQIGGDFHSLKLNPAMFVPLLLGLTAAVYSWRVLAGTIRRRRSDRRRTSPGAVRRLPPMPGLLLFALLAPAAVLADEGMWTFDAPPRAAMRSKYSVEPDAAWFEHLRLSAVKIPGCSASFVSADGLILTNHHCVRGCLEALSSADRDLLANGILAADRTAEERCQASQASVQIASENVTAEVLAAGSGVSTEAAGAARKAAMSRIEAACSERMKSQPGDHQCEVRELYQGGEYWLYTSRRYVDVRMVFAPEGAIAHFGGDPDNFDFPRYCLDMALLRVYENGAPAKTPNHLSFSAKGIAAGEPVFVPGHPGATQRLLTMDQLLARRDVDYPVRIQLRSEQRGRLIEFGKRSPEHSRVAKPTLQGIENNIKRERGQMRALLDDAAMARKRAEEDRLRAQVAADPKLAAAYGGAWDEIRASTDAYRELFLRYGLLELRQGVQGALFNHAWSLHRGAIERPKANPERLREYSDSALVGVAQRLAAKTPISNDLEILQLTFSLEKLREFLSPDDSAVRELLKQESPAALAKRVVEGTRLGDPAFRKSLWDGPPEAVLTSNDPLLVLARTLDLHARPIRKAWDDRVDAVETKAGQKIAAARFAILGTGVYPDATSTLRLTYGSVQPFEKNGAPVGPFTNMGGVFDRATDEYPFALPTRWLEKKSQIRADIPFNFVMNTDTIGGNSGSPVVDKHGKLVGLNFDGNPFSLSGAFWFNEQKNRSIAVDSRAILHALETIYGAKGLVEEIRGR